MFICGFEKKLQPCQILIKNFDFLCEKQKSIFWKKKLIQKQRRSHRHRGYFGGCNDAVFAADSLKHCWSVFNSISVFRENTMRVIAADADSAAEADAGFLLMSKSSTKSPDFLQREVDARSVAEADADFFQMHKSWPKSPALQERKAVSALVILASSRFSMQHFAKFMWHEINFVKKKSLKNALFWNHLFSIEGITDFVSFKKFSFRSQNLGSKLAQALNDDISKLKFQIWESVIYLEMSKSRIRNSGKIENYWLQFSDFLQKVWHRISTFKWENVTF